MPTATLFPARAIRLRREATISSGPDGAAIDLGDVSLPLPSLPPRIRALLDTLAQADVSEADAQADLAAEGMQPLLRWQALVTRLDAGGLIERSVLTEDGPVARLRQAVPGRPPAGPARAPGGPDGPGAARAPGRPAGSAARAPAVARLSRFTAIRAAGGVLIAGHPGSPAQVELTPATAGLLAALADWTGTRDGLAGLSAPLTRAVLDLFAGAGLLAPGDPENDLEQSDAALAQWTPADLELHAVSRGTRLTRGYGGSYPLSGRFPPLPAVRPALGGRRLELPRPDLALVARADRPLTEVLEQRHSTRAHDPAAPITLGQLGELLYRAARIRHVFDCEDGQQGADRPYPGGGAVHELELYPLITRCDGAPAGLWHYAAADHALEHVADPGPATAALVAGARSAGIMAADPQVVLVITARFGRVMWKYHAISYSLVLKHVGVLYQTIYLVAAAMGLAVCGLGGGDAADFAAASGLPYHAEGSVGELVIGTHPKEAEKQT